jgi:protein-tyrosine phosphatase
MAAATKPEPHPWFRELAWLAFLAPFFFVSYGFANGVTSLRGDVRAIVFGWERWIPFVPWTIVPYWSTDLLYAASLFVCLTRRELNAHARRLIAAQLISVSCFLLFPLRFTFQRPATQGLFGAMVDALGSFDKPFNQAPSLHVSLTVIMWYRFSAHLRGLPLWLMRAWLAMAALSTLTTYQHHFIDLPTGFLVGLVLTRRTGLQTCSSLYLLASLFLTAAALWFGGPFLLLLWPATSLLIVSAAYFTARPGIFTKRRGALHPAMTALLAPYLAAAWLNSRLWTRHQPPAQEIAAGVWIGRIPKQGELEAIGIASIVDLTAELPFSPGSVSYCNVPMLDLAVPTVRQLDAAVDAIERFTAQRPTLVCCALGYSRSAVAIAAWMVRSGHAASIEEAIGIIRSRRPRVALGAAHLARLKELG